MRLYNSPLGYNRGMRIFKTSLILLCIFSLLAACGAKPTATTAPTAAPTAAPSSPAATPTRAPSPTPAATKAPAQRSLVVCVGQEPPSLYLYGKEGRSTAALFEALYDGPFDTRKYTPQPVILQRLPSLAEGSAGFKAVTVQASEPVIDASGSLVSLKPGVKVLPAGCSDASCAITWDGVKELKMDQLVVTFKLLPGLKWSDGSPLTAADSVFSFQVASDPATPVTKTVIDRTASYQALDDLTVQWSGRPGYYSGRYNTFFFAPLPQHTLGKRSAAEILADQTANEKPLGWGAYTVQSWVKGDHIQLSRNPNYFRAAEGLPKFDTLVYRFLGEQSDNNLAALLVGECDIVEQSTLLQNQLETLLELEKNKKLKAYIAEGPEWEHLDFGIRPASYDDSFNLAAGDRPDYFGDVRTRQAFTQCIDRERITRLLLFNKSTIPLGPIPAGHPLAAADLKPLGFDVEAANKLLDEVGWKDTDGDPATPRRAKGVKGVPDNTPLAFNYLASPANLRQKAAEIVKQSLAKCGVQITIQPTEMGRLFAPGPEGLVFGRKFDLVQFTWSAGPESACLLYTTTQIPKAENAWVGANILGYSSPELDAACDAAAKARPEQPDYKEKQQKVQRLLAKDLPVVPLYYQLKIAASRPDLCGLEMDASARSELWSLETLDYGAGCQK